MPQDLNMQLHHCQNIKSHDTRPSHVPHFFYTISLYHYMIMQYTSLRQRERKQTFYVNSDMLIQNLDKNTGLFKMIVRVLTTCQFILQMQPHVISFYGVTSRIRFMKRKQTFYVNSDVLIQNLDKNTGLFKMTVRVLTTCQFILQMQPHVISFYGVTSRVRFMFLLFPQVPQNWRYESELPMKPSPLTCYKQFVMNSIIVLTFVESQRVHI